MNKDAERTILYLRRKGIEVNAVVDNDPAIRGKTIFGVQVCFPSDLLSDFKPNAVILAAPKFYYGEICRQLAGMGYEENKHIFQTSRFYKKSSSNYSLFLADFFASILSLIKGYKIYRKIRKKYGGNIPLFLFPYAGLGDIYLVGLYLKQYFQNHNINEYAVVVTGKNCKTVADMFGIKNIEILSSDEADSLLCIYRMTGKEKLKIKLMHPYYPYTNEILMNFRKMYELFNFEFLFKQYVLGLDESAKPCYPAIDLKEDFIQDFFEKNNLKKGKTVILSPYANTVISIPDQIWIAIAEKLSQKGYCVCTSCAGEKEEPVLGTKAVNFPVDAACHIAEAAGYFIGLRSGLCDIIMKADCRKVILYPRKHSLFFSYKNMETAEKIYEVLIESNEENILNEILNYFKEI